jgi:hypothetical protein
MIYYVKENCMYIDYNTLKERTGKSHTYLSSHLNNVEVKKMYYRNRLLFKYDDILKSDEINRFFL